MLTRAASLATLLVSLFATSLFGQNAPNVSYTSPSSGPVGTSVAIVGQNFGATQGSSTVSFNGTQATPTSWSDTQIVAPVPAGATTGTVQVTVGGVVSNGGYGPTFTVGTPPNVSYTNPTSGPVGTVVTITGQYFGATQGASTVSFNGTQAIPTSWSDTQIVASVPTGATTGTVSVTVNGVVSNGGYGPTFTVGTPPNVSYTNPASGPVGTVVTITGQYFGATQGTSTVSFNGTQATPTSWNDTQIVASVPTGATTGKVSVTVNGVVSNGGYGPTFTVGTPPNVSYTNPASGPVGTVVTITGQYFGATQGTSTVSFNGTAATPTSWSDGQIVAPVPSGATTGIVSVSVNGVVSNGGYGPTFTVGTPPNVSYTSPSSGPVGTSVTIVGQYFGATQGTSTISFNRTQTTPTSWSDTQILAPVPAGATTGQVSVTVNGIVSNGGYGPTFTVVPQITSIAVSPQTATSPVGTKARFTATATFSDGSTKDVSTSAAWSSTSPQVASVNSFGLAQGLAAGGASIQATVGSVSGSANLTVQPPALLGLTIQPALGGTIVGGTLQFTATGAYSDGSSQDITTAVTWSSTNPGIATISAGGLSTGVASGSTTISARLGGIMKAANLSVRAAAAPPTITAVASPGANANGWNTSNVTVTFTCAAGSSAIVNCPAPQVASSEGTSQVISGTVVDASGNTATASVTLNIDKTPPAVAITAPSDGTVSSTATIAVTGTVSDSLSGVSSVSCNGSAAVVNSGTFSCNISLNVGVNLVKVRAADVAGNVAGLNFHLSLAGALPAPQSLQIQPANANMVVGETMQFAAVDEKGLARPDATWTISDPTLGTISSDSSPQLTAIAIGTVTLTASVQGATAQAKANIGTSLTPGTVRWSVPAGSGLTPRQVVQAIPSQGNTPDLYAVEEDASDNAVVTALSVDGSQMWQSHVATFPAIQTVPDAFGGVLVVSEAFSNVNFQLSFSAAVVDLDATTGEPIWSYNSPSVLQGMSSPAIGQDGTVFFVESTFPDPNGNNSASVVALSGSTGAPLFRVPLPSGSSESFDSQGNPKVQTFSPSWNDAPMIDSSGKFSIAVVVENGVNSNGVLTVSSTLTLFQVTPDGTPSLTLIRTSNVNAFNLTPTWGVIPDGEAGQLVAWDDESLQPALAYVTRIGPSGQSDYAFPSLRGEAGIYPMVLGDNTTAYLSDGRTLQAFDVNSGQVGWTYVVPDSDFISPAVAAAGGGLVATDLVGQNPGPNTQTFIRFDPVGNPTTDPWSAQVPYPSQVDYFIGDRWTGPSSGNAITAYSAAPVQFSTSAWFSKQQGGSNKAVQDVHVTNASSSGPNQTIISSVLGKIKSALDADAASAHPTCSAWLQNNGITGSAFIQTLLDINTFGHGSFAETTAAFFLNGKALNPDGSPIGIPDSFAITVNDDGAFFKPNAKNGQPFVVGPREYAGATLRAQAAILIHETAHAVIGPPGFLNDNGIPKAEKSNDKLVDQHCRNLIEGLK